MTGERPLSEAYPITAELAVQAVYDDILCPLDIVGGFLGAKPSDHPGPQLRHYSELCTWASISPHENSEKPFLIETIK
jgi:hypothetical protein